MAEAARIGIYLRLRPPRRSAGRVAVDAEGRTVEFNVPKDAAQGLINNSKESYRFQFDGVFTPEAQQDAVFEAIARPAVADALGGINGTVFAYGQTGSGKTFTVTGGTERYADRGLIPRAVAAVFQEIQKRSGQSSYAVQVSYLELYNEEGYDLLDPTREVKRMEDLPRVFVMEDDDCRMHVRNLSVHSVANEEEALNLLFLGDTNRMVAETPLNQASSRSHAIFTLQIEARRAGEDLVRRSKLHFVDLAGSERVTKTGIEGTILKEAKYINLSLHFLEQVIIALQEKRPHIPYRNSLLTQMLRDSLGGNCRTVMIANVAPETQHLEESISTCRFAQRVAMISNQVTVNEEVDPSLVIRRLKQENLALRQELQLLKGGGGGAEGPGEGGSGEPGGGSGGGGRPWQTLGEEEEAALRQQVLAFVEDASPEAALNVEASMVAIRTAFSIFKSLVRERRAPAPARPQAAAAEGGSTAGGAQPVPVAGEPEEDPSAEVASLRSALQQKEREVALLVGMLRKQGADPSAAVAAAAAAAGPGTSAPADDAAPLSVGNGPLLQLGAPAAVPLEDALLADKNRAFEYFCASSPTHDAIQENKALLRGKYDDARGLGARVNASKQRIGELKGLIEQRRVQRSMAALMAGQQPPEGEDPEEDRAKGLIQQEKALYRQALGGLKEVKSEIDTLQAMLEHSRGRLQREFAAWYALVLGQLPPERRAAVEAAAAAAEQGPAGDWTIAAMGGAAAVAAPDPLLPPPKGQLGAPPGAAGAKPRPPSRQLSMQGSTAALMQPSFSIWAAVPVLAAGGGGGGAEQQQPPPSAWRGSRPPTAGGLAAAPGSRLDLGGALAAAGAGSSPRPQSSRGAAAAAPAAAGAAAAPPPPPDYGGVDPEVLAAARPLLTGNAAADADILKFYEARAALLKSYRG